jgi:hypothetical protein
MANRTELEQMNMGFLSWQFQIPELSFFKNIIDLIIALFLVE